MKTFIIEATFEDRNENQQSIIIGKTLAKDKIEAHKNMCKNIKQKMNMLFLECVDTVSLAMLNFSIMILMKWKLYNV